MITGTQDRFDGSSSRPAGGELPRIRAWGVAVGVSLLLTGCAIDGQATGGADRPVEFERLLATAAAGSDTFTTAVEAADTDLGQQPAGPATGLAELLRGGSAAADAEPDLPPTESAAVGSVPLGELLRHASESDWPGESQTASSSAKPLRLAVLSSQSEPFWEPVHRTNPFAVPTRQPLARDAAESALTGAAPMDALPTGGPPTGGTEQVEAPREITEMQAENRPLVVESPPLPIATDGADAAGRPLPDADPSPRRASPLPAEGNVVKAATLQLGPEIIPLPLDSTPAEVLEGQLPLSASGLPGAAPSAVPVDPAAACGGSSYRIEIGDQVQLKFLYRPDLNETLIVGDDGLITPAMTPPVCAAGKTEAMLHQELQRLIARRDYDAIANQEDHQSVEYLIAINDEIEVRFETASDLNDQVTVRPDGRISLALIGEVVAEGKTPSALQTELEQRYAAKRKNAELVVIMRKTTSPNIYRDGVAVPLPIKGIEVFTVSVLRTAPRLVYVLGEVGLPSAVPYYPNITAIRAISSSGGAKRSANLKHTMILRRGGQCGVRQINVDLRPCRDCTTGFNSHTDGGFADVALQPNDVIMIPKTKIAKVQDWLDQYVYDLFPPLRNSSAFTVLFNQGIPGFNAP